MQNSAWKKHKSCGTSSLFPMTPKKPQQWLQVVGHAGLFIWSHLSFILHFSVCNSGKKYLSNGINGVFNISCVSFSLLVFTGSFHVGDYGTLLKRFCEGEQRCYLRLMKDSLSPFVPAYHGVVQRDDQDYNRMDNLLTHFNTPAIMDCKMGSR